MYIHIFIYKYCSAVIIEFHGEFHAWKLFCTDFIKIYTEYLKIFLQISVKKKIFIKVIQYIIFKDLQKNIASKNSPALFFDILYYTTIIDEDIKTGFKLENLLNKLLLMIIGTKVVRKRVNPCLGMLVSFGNEFGNVSIQTFQTLVFF